MAQQSKLGHVGTSVTQSHGFQRVVYHQTEVVKFNRGKIVLNTGGFFTSTTKTRMNQASNQFGLGYRVFARNGEWFVEFRHKVYPFKDGIELARP